MILLLLAAWPVEPGWKSERIPFPLEFAPTLAHKGDEELRFAPGMFNPAADDYFSYAFVWIVGKDERVDAGKELPVYFDGLCKAVDAKVCTPAKASASEVQTVDAFKAKKPLRLFYDVTTRACGDRQAHIFRVSPQPRVHAVWKTLGKVADSFRCET